MMKRIFYGTICFGILVVSASIAYYFLIISPKVANDRLEFEKQKQAATEAHKKDQLKQECLALQQKSAEARREPGYIPNVQDYRISNMDCSEQ